MSRAEVVSPEGEVLIPDPPFARSLFNTTKFAWLWLILRLYPGYTWLTAGWGKLNDPAWMQGGVALKGFWANAVAIPESGSPPITYEWYRSFLQFMLDNDWYTWFAPLLAVTEFVVGLLLLLGAFTGLAAFAGSFLNLNFMLAGTASINPVLFTISILLMLAWKVAGWYGLDRWLLPRLGTPWARSPGTKESFGQP